MGESEGIGSNNVYGYVNVIIVHKALLCSAINLLLSHAYDHLIYPKDIILSIVADVRMYM